jgi:hypothetical protein
MSSASITSRGNGSDDDAREPPTSGSFVAIFLGFWTFMQHSIAVPVTLLCGAGVPALGARTPESQWQPDSERRRRSSAGGGARSRPGAASSGRKAAENEAPTSSSQEGSSTLGIRAVRAARGSSAKRLLRLQQRRIVAGSPEQSLLYRLASVRRSGENNLRSRPASCRHSPCRSSRTGSARWGTSAVAARRRRRRPSGCRPRAGGSRR